MAFTYDISTSRGKVRWRVGDTTDAGHQLEDAEIDAVLSDTSNLDIAAVRCCEAIVARLAKTMDRSVVGISSSRTQQYTQYKELLTELRARVVSGGGSMTAYSGGTSIARNDTIRDDTDNNPPRFTVERDSNGTNEESLTDD